MSYFLVSPDGSFTDGRIADKQQLHYILGDNMHIALQDNCTICFSMPSTISKWNVLGEVLLLQYVRIPLRFIPRNPYMRGYVCGPILFLGPSMNGLLDEEVENLYTACTQIHEEYLPLLN